MTPFDAASSCDRLADEIDALDAAVRAADPGAPVPACPGWSVADLARHLGGVHRWADRMIELRTTTPISRRDIDMGTPDPGADANTWADWLTAGGRQVLVQLRATPPETAVWTWGDAGTSGWWARRLLHETMVHRLDVLLTADPARALATDPATVDPAVAADAVDEHLANLPAASAFSEKAAELRGEGSLHLHATDTDGEWMIDLRPDGFAVRREHGKGTVAARGAAVDVLAALSARGPVDRLEVFGDAALLDWWIDHNTI